VQRVSTKLSYNFENTKADAESNHFTVATSVDSQRSINGSQHPCHDGLGSKTSQNVLMYHLYHVYQSNIGSTKCSHGFHVHSDNWVNVL
jgi:hypothetical protein